ncbi:peptidase dimerization domain-containing protein [Aquabacterium sp.]|uniref:peptidase dimerization domain-containing protein n=1 Tax=Aquabacterium sp. TaxID=1872578 RepID=UPI0039C86B1E
MTAKGPGQQPAPCADLPSCADQASPGVIEACFRFTGRAAHAAASPQLGRSALDAVELMIVGVNFLREHLPAGARIQHAITDTGGSTPNVVQHRAAVLYTVRSPDSGQVAPLFERVHDVARGAALMTETELIVELDRSGGANAATTATQDFSRDNA